LLEIFKEKFNLFNLYKLYQDVGLALDIDLDKDDVALSKGKLSIRKRTGTAKELQSVKQWFNAFLHYVAILARLDA
jgi:hypothetical protein